jgi:hypothetical protein
MCKVIVEALKKRADREVTAIEVSVKMQKNVKSSKNLVKKELAF